MAGTIRLSAICTWTLLVVACARPPVAELEAYKVAFNGVRSSTDALLEVYAPIERTERAPPESETFDPEAALYYATMGEPPISEYTRRGVRVIDHFNDILVAYAEGRSWEQIEPHADRFATSAAALIGFVTTAGVVPMVFEGLGAFAASLRTVSDRAAFERLVRDRAGAVMDVFTAMRDISPAMFTHMANNARSREQRALLDGRDEEAAALRRQPAQYRTLLADWVVLLGTARGALSDLREAVERGSVTGPDLADLADWGEEINARAIAVKAAIAALRSAA